MSKSILSKKILYIVFIGLLTFSLMHIVNEFYVSSGDLSNNPNYNFEIFSDTNSYFNAANISSSSILFAADPDDENDPTKISPGAKITLTSDKSVYKVGDTATFYVRIQNTGNIDLSNIVVNFLLPKELKFSTSNTGTNNNQYHPNSGTWSVGNLRLTASGAGLGAGVKQLTVTGVITPEMAGKNYNLKAYFVSLEAEGKSVLSMVSSSYSSFSVESNNTVKNNNTKNNSATNGVNSTGNGKGSKNNSSNSQVASNLANISKKLKDKNITLNDIKNNWTGLKDINSIDDDNPSSENLMHEVKNISDSDSNSESPMENPIFLFAGLILAGIIVIGYFYGIKK